MGCGYTCSLPNNDSNNICHVPEGSSLDRLPTVGPIEGEESGGGWLSTTGSLLEANFFAAVTNVGESDVSTMIIKCVCA